MLEKAKEAQGKSLEGEVKETIQLLLYEYSMEKLDKEELTLLDFFEQKKDEGKIDDVKDNEDGTIEVKLKGYTVTINIEQRMIIKIEISNDIEFRYQLISYDNNKFNVLIKISDEKNGIDTIKYPEGNTKTYNGQNEVEIEYELEEARDYKFVVKNTKGIEKEEVINFTKPTQPEFKTIKMGYPTLTLAGIEEPKVEIEYDSGTEFEKYYSLDNGETWNLYTKPINTTTKTIKAKSVHKKCSEIYTETNITLEQEKDALTEEGYDNNLETSKDYFNGHPTNAISSQFKFNVDSTTWGQSCDIYFMVWKNMPDYHRDVKVYFYDTMGDELDSGMLGNFTTNLVYNVRVAIPENTATIAVNTDLPPSIYDVCINRPVTPRIVAQYEDTNIEKMALEQPILTSNGVVNCKVVPEIGTKIKLEISGEAREGIENYYSLDGGENWKLYTNSIEVTYQGEGLIQAKSINQYNKVESTINTLKNYVKDLEIECTAENAVRKEAYDGDEETFSQGRKNMIVDSSAEGMRIKVKYRSYGYRTINLFHTNGLFSWTPNGENGTFERVMIIKNGSKAITIR